MSGLLKRLGIPIYALILALVAMYAIPHYSDSQATEFNFFNAMQNFAALGLISLGVGLTIIAGEFDISTLGMYTLAGMVAVMAGQNSAFLGVLAVLGLAAVIGAIQGGIVAYTGISSMPVTIGGYFVLLGAAGALSGDTTVAYQNQEVGRTLDAEIAGLLSLRSLIALAVFAVVAAVLRYTRIGRDLRAIGGDRRGALIAGVRVKRILIGTFIVSAMLAGLGGALLAYSIGAARPDVGMQPLIFGVTATLVGGVTLTGGRGTALGICAGAIALSLLNEIFSILAVSTMVSSLVFGGLMLLVVVADAPDLKERVSAARTRRRLAKLESSSDGGSLAAERST